MIGVRLQPEDLAMLDEWRVDAAGARGRPSTRPEAIRELMNEGSKKWRLKKKKEPFGSWQWRGDDD